MKNPLEPIIENLMTDKHYGQELAINVTRANNDKSVWHVDSDIATASFAMPDDADDVCVMQKIRHACNNLHLYAHIVRPEPGRIDALIVR